MSSSKPSSPPRSLPFPPSVITSSGPGGSLREGGRGRELRGTKPASMDCFCRKDCPRVKKGRRKERKGFEDFHNNKKDPLKLVSPPSSYVFQDSLPPDFKWREGRKEHEGKLTTNLFHSYFSFFRPIRARTTDIFAVFPRTGGDVPALPDALLDIARNLFC